MYGRDTGTGTSRSPPLHSSVREDYGSFRFAVADASFCCNDVSAIHTLVVVRTTFQSAIVVGSTHCKHEQSSADEVQGLAITHF